MPAQTPLLDISNLSKTFGRIDALAHVRLSIQPGESFALLGLNGAGKSTLFRCLLGILRPSEGRILFNGRPLTPADVHRDFGYLPERFQPPVDLSAREWLDALRKTTANGLTPDAVLERVGLRDRRNQRIRTYSHGMVQRLGLAMALLKNPKILIVDEPFIGLDVAGQRSVVELFGALHHQGATILFSSHLLAHLEACAQRVGILHQGRLQCAQTPETLCRTHQVMSLEEAFCREVGLDETTRSADVA